MKALVSDATIHYQNYSLTDVMFSAQSIHEIKQIMQRINSNSHFNARTPLFTVFKFYLQALNYRASSSFNGGINSGDQRWFIILESCSGEYKWRCAPLSITIVIQQHSNPFFFAKRRAICCFIFSKTKKSYLDIPLKTIDTWSLIRLKYKITFIKYKNFNIIEVRVLYFHKIRK